MIQAPPAEVFPEYPASWYLFGESREIRKGPVSAASWAACWWRSAPRADGW